MSQSLVDVWRDSATYWNNQSRSWQAVANALAETTREISNLVEDLAVRLTKVNKEYLDLKFEHEALKRSLKK